MNIEATLKFDEAFLIESLRRNRTQSRALPFLRAVKIACGVILTAFMAILMFGGHIAVSFIFAPFIVLLSLCHQLETPFIKRRFRKSPFYSLLVKFEFREDDLRIYHDKADIKMSWDSFTRAVIFDDGILAYQGEGLFNWFPKQIFSSEDDYVSFENLVKTKIQKIISLTMHYKQ